MLMSFGIAPANLPPATSWWSPNLPPPVASWYPSIGPSSAPPPAPSPLFAGFTSNEFIGGGVGAALGGLVGNALGGHWIIGGLAGLFVGSHVGLMVAQGQQPAQQPTQPVQPQQQPFVLPTGGMINQLTPFIKPGGIKLVVPASSKPAPIDPNDANAGCQAGENAAMALSTMEMGGSIGPAPSSGAPKGSPYDNAFVSCYTNAQSNPYAGGQENTV